MGRRARGESFLHILNFEATGLIASQWICAGVYTGPGRPRTPYDVGVFGMLRHSIVTDKPEASQSLTPRSKLCLARSMCPYMSSSADRPRSSRTAGPTILLEARRRQSRVQRSVMGSFGLAIIGECMGSARYVFSLGLSYVAMGEGRVDNASTRGLWNAVRSRI